MTSHLRTVVTSIVVLASIAVPGSKLLSQQIYQCEQDGRTVFQDTPCVKPARRAATAKCKVDGAWYPYNDPKCMPLAPQDSVSEGRPVTDPPPKPENERPAASTQDREETTWVEWVSIVLAVAVLGLLTVIVAFIGREKSQPLPSEHAAPTQEDSETKAITEYVAVHSKSYGIAFVLALLFGPIGLLYASPLAGAIMILLALFLFSGWGMVGGIVVWLLSVLLCFGGVSNSKRRALSEAQLITSK